MGFFDTIKRFAKKTDPIVYKGVSTAVKYSKKFDYVRTLKKKKDRASEKRAATWDKYYATQNTGSPTGKSESQNLISRNIKSEADRKRRRLLVSNYDSGTNGQTILGG